jgi:hypothetical protein
LRFEVWENRMRGHGEKTGKGIQSVIPDMAKPLSGMTLTERSTQSLITASIEIWDLIYNLMDFSDDTLLRTAFHEAGHAWMMWKEGLGVNSISMEPLSPIQADNRGETIQELAMEEDRKELSEKFAKAALAGSAAEHFLLGNWDEESLQASAYDKGRARGFMAMSGTDWKPEDLEHYVHSLSNSVMEEISRPKVWHTITCLAYELMEKGTMTREEVTFFLET